MSERSASHMKFMALQRTMNTVNNVAEKCAGLLLLGMIVAISISVLARLLYTYTGIPLSAPWAEEIARYMMVGSVFIGGAVAAYHLRLIGVDVFISMIPERTARWLRLLSHLLTLALALLLVWKSIHLIELGMRQWSPALEMPMAYVYSLMAIGCLLMCANTLTNAVKELLNVELPQRESAEMEEAMEIKNSVEGAI
ncbi:TRAP transporter small permease [Achromobacter denitrificans]|uniref:TRAP transporter small permease protein n=2 Tax=Achromobacter denitrificans TaxID=32002 RepID=A0A3R9H1P1_ACHDE|nr:MULTISPECIES: TRAP transporter small permease [Achromobacter]ASC63919.1 TRAP transporter small permease [Achromobacter denitrificans]MBV2162103.1 TRAP transporter small permease [Achromobacter denitrificans]MDF3849290.1 TRAP transporter small permease [Achromobacter denitrificans]MDF3860274.1 TRAP transporter small permease [Achromobacter denitrificans]MDF3941135.1 TRAP transporter small permease [Achromobacter denitrificans]